MFDSRTCVWGVAALIGMLMLPAGAAGPAINACKVLPAADLEAMFGQKVTVAGTDASGTWSEGPMKGETKYSCAWWLGGPVFNDRATFVVVDVISRPPVNEDQIIAVSQYRGSEKEWKKKGVPIEITAIPGGDCRVYQRPEAPITSCIGGAKGRGLVLDVAWPKGATARSLKPLVDKALSRL